MAEKDEGYKLWIAMEREKDEVLKLISERGTIDVMQASDFLRKSVDDTKPLLERLEKEGLIQRKIGSFYQLTYKGYKRVRDRSTKEYSSYSEV